MTGRRIVADVGGTRSRFGISRGPGDLSEIRVYPTAGQSSFAEALATYVIDIGAGPAEGWCGGAYIAAAGPVDQGAVQLTNAAWSISAREVSQHLGGVPVALVNDLEAVGLLLPHLQASDLAPIGSIARAELIGSRIAVNVGTGFGAATAVRVGGTQWAIAAGEAGHMSLAPTTAEEAAVFGFGRTVEDLLSGIGIRRLYASHARGAARGDRAADTVFAAASTDPAAARTAQMFSRLLGRITGDLVLATAAWDGAFLCGGVAKAWLDVADVGAFRAAFEDKGPMRARMSSVPTFAITVPEPALLGLTHAAPRAG
ncbi:ROK family protein [Hyphomicrobium sp. CS1BSMeth3]|uniref:glucokinase n=1 Tax=Hyphomicrobium sp. CS1BSMeth3 TaxID=1892844 RepID=UPI000930578A|nr:ROK family protein [Hyphomicrobium sp. CS1BSMeth3]